MFVRGSSGKIFVGGVVGISLCGGKSGMISGKNGSCFCTKE